MTIAAVPLLKSARHPCSSCFSKTDLVQSISRANCALNSLRQDAKNSFVCSRLDMPASRNSTGRRDCSVWNSHSIRPLAWGMLVVLDLPNHGWREASIWIISPQYWHLGRRGCGSSAKSSFSAGWNVWFLHIKWCRHLRYIKTLSYAKHKVSCCRCKKRSFKSNE